MILITSSLMLFFWSIFDGIISYTTPVIMESRGLSNSQIGLLISLSAVSGAFFDIIISKYFKSSHYLRYFIFTFIICLSYPLILWSASHFFIYVLLMTFWGIYYDFLNFGIYDLSARISRSHEHTKNISFINGFKSAGYLLGPLIITYLIASWTLTSSAFFFVYLFLAISLSLYVVLFSLSRPQEFISVSTKTPKTPWYHELILWRRFAKILFPVLIFNTTFFIFEAAFWTIGPIFSQQFPEIKYFSVLFMGVYILPAILVMKFAENITSLFGKKKTAYVSFIISSLFLIPLSFVTTPFSVLFLIFFSTIFGSLAWSAMAGALIDYLSESEINDSEIIGLKDFSANIGYIIGPIIAGVLPDLFGIQNMFAIIGFICALIVIFLLFITPKHINVRSR